MVKIKKQKVRLNIAPSPELINYIAHNIPKRSLEYSRDRLEVMLDSDKKADADAVKQQILDMIVEITPEGWEEDVPEPVQPLMAEKDKASATDRAEKIRTRQAK